MRGHNESPPARGNAEGGAKANNQNTDNLAERLEALKAEISPNLMDSGHWNLELALVSAAVLAERKPAVFKTLVETVLELEETVRDSWGPARWYSFTGDGRRDARRVQRDSRAETAKARSRLFQEVVIAGARDHCAVMGRLEVRAYAAGVWPLLSPRDRRALIQSTEGRP